MLFVLSSSSACANAADPNLKQALSAISSLADTQVAIADELTMGSNRLSKACGKPKKDEPLTPDIAALDNTKSIIMDRKVKVAERQTELVAIAKVYRTKVLEQKDRDCGWLDKVAAKLPPISGGKPSACQVATQNEDLAKSVLDQVLRLQASSAIQHDALLEYIQLERVGCLDVGFSKSLVEKFMAMQTDQDDDPKRQLQNVSKQTHAPKR
jgi:hypothetical protein